MKTDFNWESRIESELEGIRWILRRDNADTGLLNKAADSIETQLRKLISDVQATTINDLKKK